MYVFRRWSICVDPSADESHQAYVFNEKANAPCPYCHASPANRQLETPFANATSDAKYDGDEASLTKESGICPFCVSSYLASGGPAWRHCACGFELSQLEERMKNAALDEMTDGGVSQALIDDKVEAERGKPR